MSTILVFLMTVAELAAIAIGYFAPMPMLYHAFVTYGSPIAFILNLLGTGSVITDGQLFFPLLALFHVVKYMLLCRSQFGEERRSLHFLAVIFEISYLVLCALYI